MAFYENVDVYIEDEVVFVRAFKKEKKWRFVFILCGPRQLKISLVITYFAFVELVSTGLCMEMKIILSIFKMKWRCAPAWLLVGP